MKNINILHPEGRFFFGEPDDIKVLASGFKFCEGPVWHPDGCLLFSDIEANKIFQVYMNGVMHVLVHQSGGPCITYTYLSNKIGSNGLAFDHLNNLIFCQHGNHSIAKMDGKNMIHLCCSYNGRSFNSPRDLVLNSAGDIYFTDPPYGLKNEVLNPNVFQPHSGIYLFKNNQVLLLSTDLKYPNGISFSKDEKYLFVSSNHPDEQMILKYEVAPNGALINKSVFVAVNADGIKTDNNNNLFAATKEGVLILSPTGEKLALIGLPQMATNLTFGGLEKELLFITTPSSIYKVKLSVQKPASTLEDTNEKPAKKIKPPAAVS